MREEFLIPIVMFVGLFSVIGLKILADVFARVVCHWRDVSLKMRLIDAGFAPHEIEQVVAAGRSDRPASAAAHADRHGAPPIRKPDYVKQGLA